jgi:uncharacterized iron-regulated membrane protein
VKKMQESSMTQTNAEFVDEMRSLTARRKSLFWRIHFWAALIASPFALVAALTGILYIFTPQVEEKLYASLQRVAPIGAMQPLDDAVEAAELAVPDGLALRAVVPPYGSNDAVKVYFAPGTPRAGREHHHGHVSGAAARPIVMYVDPYTAQVLGSQTDMERFGDWSRQLHSSLLQGDGWRWMIELAASWLMVMLITGIYLWWPRGAQKALPQKDAKGRNAWKQWHALIGVVLSVMSLTILTTGLTWSKYAGKQVRAMRDITGQAPPQTPRNLRSTIIGGQPPLTWQKAWDIARRAAPAVTMQLSSPQAEDGTWRAISFDPSEPQRKFELVLDSYSGQTLFYGGWDRQTAFAKATAIGIPFHRGEFGLWNQALLLVFGIGVVFSLVSGWVMYFRRRQPGSLGLPRLLPGAWKSAPPGAWMAAAALFAAMPLLALSSAAVVAVELALRRRDQS